MRNNIGRGYFIEEMDLDYGKVVLEESIVDVYLPEHIKKDSHLNREPIKGDILETSSGTAILLMEFFHRDDSQVLQERLVHGTKIILPAKDFPKLVLINDTETETSLDKLLDSYYKKD